MSGTWRTPTESTHHPPRPWGFLLSTPCSPQETELFSPDFSRTQSKPEYSGGLVGRAGGRRPPTSPGLQTWGHLSPCCESHRTARRDKSEWGRWGLVAPHHPGDAAKQSHSGCPRAWQSWRQSRLTCLCVLCRGYLTSASLLVKGPDTTSLTGRPQARLRSSRNPARTGPGTLTALDGSRLSSCWYCFPPPHTVEPALTCGRCRAQQRPEK